MRKFFKWFGILIGLFLLLVLAGFLLLYLITPDRLNVLVVGSDQRGDERARSDVLMVLSVPKGSGKPLTLLTIPRDTYVDIPGHGMDKITHAYAFGEREEGSLLGGINLTQQTVENFLDIKHQATVEVTFSSFEEIVDMFGGVLVGGNLLNGEEALAIVRDRYREGGDFARTEDQREVLMSLSHKLKSRENAMKLYDYFQTNDRARLQFGRVPVFAFGAFFVISHFGQLDISDIEEQVIPGYGDMIYSPAYEKDLYYWIPDEEELEKLKEEYLQ